jgi:hypothetical protein
MQEAVAVEPRVVRQARALMVAGTERATTVQPVLAL